MTKILLIDDHVLIRNGLRIALETIGYEVIGEAASKTEAFAQIAHKNPDCIIVDINLPDGSGIEIVRWARDNSPSIAIIVLSIHQDSQHIIAAMKSGASAFLEKSSSLSEIMVTIKHAIAVPSVFSARHLAAAILENRENFFLSSRELEVLAILKTDQSYRDLAKFLSISEATLKSHIASIFRKLDVKSRLAAVNKARQAGLV